MRAAIIRIANPSQLCTGEPRSHAHLLERHRNNLFLPVQKLGRERTGIREEDIAMGKKKIDGNSETQLCGQSDGLKLS